MSRYLLLLLAAAAPALWAQTLLSTLPNGMKVLVEEDNRAPVVSVRLWYRVGSVDEHPGKTGLSHALEHMMFKGTKAVPAGQFSRRIAALGGSDNAYTNRTDTVYTTDIASRHLDEVLRMEADRMGGLNFSDRDFANEMDVIREERRMRTDDSPSGKMWETLNMKMWRKPFNQAPVIGYMADLHTLKADDLRAWYRQWYAPNNAMLVIAGDVDAQKTVKTAQRIFGGIPARDLPPRNDEAESPAAATPVSAEVAAATAQPLVSINWRVPKAEKIGDETPYALDMLSLVLAGTDSARYDKKLQRGDAVALAVSAGYNDYGRKNALFSVTAMPNGGITPAALKARLMGEIRDIAAKGVTQQELDLVRVPVETGRIFAKDSVRNRADTLGALEQNGFGWQSEDETLRRLLAVTPAQVQAAARLLLAAPAAEITVLPQQNAAPPQNGRLKNARPAQTAARAVRNKAEKP